MGLRRGPRALCPSNGALLPDHNAFLACVIGWLSDAQNRQKTHGHQRHCGPSSPPPPEPAFPQPPWPELPP
jgi:hypothetical protein